VIDLRAAGSRGLYDSFIAVSCDWSRRSYGAIGQSPLVAVRPLRSRDRRVAACARELARRGQLTFGAPAANARDGKRSKDKGRGARRRLEPRHFACVMG
jgi:hypothetical protein